MNVSSCIVLKKWNYGANNILVATFFMYPFMCLAQHTFSISQQNTILKFYKIGKLMSKVGNYRVTIVTTCCTYCTNGQFVIRVIFLVVASIVIRFAL